ncbi:hypothetical protein Lpp78_12071, partial [Lacticaseibacillus paracasei subsp. paracasei CNCM I-2877]
MKKLLTMAQTVGMIKSVVNEQQRLPIRYEKKLLTSID